VAYEAILYNVEDGVAVVTLNRPDRLNAWSGAMHREVKAAMRAATDNDAVRVIVLTGAGRGFCAGADMNDLDSIQSDGGEALSSSSKGEAPFDPSAPEHFKKTYSYFPSVPKPIIAAINGPAAGLGLIMALYTDMRFAADSAVFTTAFAKRGLIAEHGIGWLLPRLVGMGRAADLLFSARKVTAKEAYDMHLVDRLMPADTFMTETMAYAKELANLVSPRSLREMKREIWRDQFLGLGEAIERANEDMYESLASNDFKEGVAHFIEKRTPNFTGT
jgi:enoyl-CoA hydratase/carnithine racemase